MYINLEVIVDIFIFFNLRMKRDEGRRRRGTTRAPQHSLCATLTTARRIMNHGARRSKPNLGTNTRTTWNRWVTGFFWRVSFWVDCHNNVQVRYQSCGYHTLTWSSQSVCWLTKKISVNWIALFLSVHWLWKKLDFSWLTSLL